MYDTDLADSLFEQALDKWGQASQIDMVLEECGELIAALVQWRRGRKVNVIEEIADVLLVVHQLRLTFGPEQVDSVANWKLARLKLRLENDNLD